jgi:hypothetical protein
MENKNNQQSEIHFLNDRVKFLTPEFSSLVETYESQNPEKSDLHSQQLKEILEMTTTFIKGGEKKLFANPTTQGRKPYRLDFPQDLNELIKGHYNSRMDYFIHTENFFINKYPNSRIPPESVSPQLQITLWSIGNEYGETQNFAQELNRISNTYLEDFTEGLKTKSIPDPNKKDYLLKKCQENGKGLKGFTTQQIRIELQDVYFDKEKGKPCYTSKINLTVEDKVDGQKILTINTPGEEKPFTILLRGNQSFKNISRLFDVVCKASTLFSPHPKF